MHTVYPFQFPHIIKSCCPIGVLKREAYSPFISSAPGPFVSSMIPALLLQGPAHFLALLGNLGAPTSLPRSLTLRTRSMALRTFWSGAALPRSKSATTPWVVLHLVARSFCVILGSIFCRALEMASPTTLPIVLGLMMSSERSTLVRRWPSPPPVCEP